MKQENIHTPFGSGIIVIVTILLVLVLSVFSALTVSTARADLALAQRGAHALQAYYAADGAAREELARFRAGDAPQFEQLFPINDMQGLYVHLERGPGENIAILNWQTVLIDDFANFTERTLPVWDGAN